jgi:hypothetical protein
VSAKPEEGQDHQDDDDKPDDVDDVVHGGFLAVSVAGSTDGGVL